MTVAQSVRLFLEQRPDQSYCDDCLTKLLGLSHPDEASMAAEGLAATGDFARGTGLCSDCGDADRQVTIAYGE